MAAFVATATVIYEYTTGATTDFVASVSMPTGTLNGDTVFFGFSIATGKKQTVKPIEGQSQIGEWQVGEADAFGTPAFGVFSVVRSGGATAWDFVFDKDATRGGGIYCWAYSGDCTVNQIAYNFDTAATGSRSGSAITIPTGNLGLAFSCTGAVGTPGVSWGGGFTERGDDEYYGNMSLGEIAGDGTSKTPSITPAISTQTIWIELDVGGYQATPSSRIKIR